MGKYELSGSMKDQRTSESVLCLVLTLLPSGTCALGATFWGNEMLGFYPMTWRSDSQTVLNIALIDHDQYSNSGEVYTSTKTIN